MVRDVNNGKLTVSEVIERINKAKSKAEGQKKGEAPKEAKGDDTPSTTA